MPPLTGGPTDGLPFDRPDVVAGYEPRTELTPAETLVLGEYVAHGARVLDLGVGTGRTTELLSELAGDYLGIDIAPNMVQRARDLHPEVRFEVGDATHLEGIDDAAFDVVVFSFNGIDYIVDRAGRDRALDEVRRVLRPGGTFVFSSHDPRAVIARRNVELGPRGVAVAALQTFRRTTRRGSLRAIRSGEGRVLDAVHGGLLTYMATPEVVAADLARHGFVLERTVPGAHPAPGRRFGTEWWYYVARRGDATRR